MYIDNLIKEATLEKNSAKKEAYRAIKAAILLNNSSKNPKPNGKMININKGTDTITLSELEISIIKKEIQVREEQVAMYEANSRKDLADMYREQMQYLKELLPPEISRDKIQEAVMSTYPNGYTQKEMGKVIKEIKNIYPTADGKIISEIVKEHIV
jgi:uncharacterized protein YqeY